MELAYGMPPEVIAPFPQQSDHLATLIIASSSSNSYNYNYSYSSKEVDYGKPIGFHTKKNEEGR